MKTVRHNDRDITHVDDIDEHEWYNSRTGHEHCPYCGKSFGMADTAYLGPVIDASGARHETLWETDPGNPHYHPECWAERQTVIGRLTNHELTEYEPNL